MRAVSRILTIGALLAVVFCYGSLPNELPVSRWHSAHKTWLLAVRVPVINLLSLGIIEVYGRSLSRYRRNSNANWIGPVLAVTAGIKALVESIEMLLLPTRHSIFAIVLIATVLAGVAFSIWCGRDLLKNENWKTLKSTCNEKAAMAALGATIIGLNVPLFLR
ncbi:hypothetical protein GC170_08200 [bacterium]|nr:hypothetical protein [bacterium]